MNEKIEAAQLPKDLRSRLLARAAMFRRAGTVRITNNNPKIRERETDHIPIADDIEMVVGMFDQLETRCEEIADENERLRALVGVERAAGQEWRDISTTKPGE
jgi:hypothetical protein